MEAVFYTMALKFDIYIYIYIYIYMFVYVYIAYNKFTTGNVLELGFPKFFY